MIDSEDKNIEYTDDDKWADMIWGDNSVKELSSFDKEELYYLSRLIHRELERRADIALL